MSNKDVRVLEKIQAHIVSVLRYGSSFMVCETELFMDILV